MEDRRRRYAGADEIAQLLLASVAADRFRGEALEHRVGRGGIEPFDVAAAGRVEAQREISLCREFGKAPADFERVGNLAREIVDQHRHAFGREGLVEHLGGTQGRTGIADQRVRHRSQPVFAAEVMGRGVRGIADEADGANLALGPGRADRGGIGHHLGHLLAGTMTGIHGEEGRLRHVRTHRPGIVGGHAGGAELLQEDRLEIDEMEERAGDVHHRFAGADPLALAIAQVEVHRRIAGAAGFLQPFQREPRREHHRTPHEDGVGDLAIAELADHLLRAIEVVVGVAFDLAIFRMRHRPSPGSRALSR